MRRLKLSTDVLSGMCLIIFGGFFYHKADNLLAEASLWPKMVLILLIILSVLLVLRGIRKNDLCDFENSFFVSVREMSAPMIALIMMAIYVTVMSYVGFFLSTAIFLPFAMYILQQRSWKVILGTTLGLEIFVYFLFVMQLNLRMP